MFQIVICLTEISGLSRIILLAIAVYSNLFELGGYLLKKTGLQPVSRTCGTTPLGLSISEEKNHTVL